ncbi:MAG: redox-regulated ATPase YchF [Spirochaetaceae bacterium]|jgi:GTP-binding protein YchF|nr:redox-regulated ATPase YchF [Spirochaetaceae bacterium]
MALNCGIVGLPNVGKSTIFSALSRAPAEAANYPFCTINPNIGIAQLNDKRLDKLNEIFKPKRLVPATVEFIDIAGLVKGASKGEGLGNQFLGHIREVGIITQVVRCWEDADIVHVNGKVDPENDMEVINIELALADLETLKKSTDRAERALKIQNAAEKKTAAITLAALAKIETALQNGRAARSVPLDETERESLRESNFITLKPQLYVCNTDEEGARAAAAGKPNAYIEAVMRRSKAEGVPFVVICGKFEAELAGIESALEKAEFLSELGLKESGLEALVRAANKLLGFITFFTAGADECRAWTARQGWTAPQAAGVIHSDFQKGFIKAEVYSFDDIVKYESEAKIKEAGKYRLEGKDYVVCDGDIMFFKFNV